MQNCVGGIKLRPVEALRFLGASPVQVLLWAIWPQARPLVSSYSVLRWETHVRRSTILGLSAGPVRARQSTTTSSSVFILAGLPLSP
jgi:phosphonate transport system permease protein